jgi:hypothetical protein
MAAETTTIKIKAERLGTIQQVKQLLTDIDNAYNSIYAFNYLIESLYNDRERRIRLFNDRFNKRDFHLKAFSSELFLLGVFWDKYFGGIDSNSSNLLQLQSQLDIEKIVIPSDRLNILKINIQSPGFWEFLGSLNPLQQIKEYLKDKHEREKDRNYRSRQEEELGELSIWEKRDAILRQRIEMLRSLGYEDAEIRQLVVSMVIEPLNKLGNHQENGQIDGIEQ